MACENLLIDQLECTSENTDTILCFDAMLKNKIFKQGIGIAEKKLRNKKGSLGW